jgi:hypothetical protein
MFELSGVADVHHADEKCKAKKKRKVRLQQAEVLG